MRAGLLRQRVELRELAEGRDEFNAATLTPSTRGMRWATVSPVRGDETFAEGSIRAHVTHKVTLRWEPDLVTPRMMVIYEGRTLRVESSVDVGSRRKMLELYCREEVRS